MKNKLGLIIGANIKARRKAKGLSQQALAELAGITSTSLFRIEKGQQARRGNLEVIAKALGCEETDLVTNEDVVKGEYAKAADVLLHLENLEPEVKCLALALIYNDPELACSADLDVSALFSQLHIKIKGPK